MLAILNAHLGKQITAEFLHVESPEKVLGLRPGEVLECTHSDEQEGGCGTSMWCSTCGTAIAIIFSLADKKPVEKIKILSISLSSSDVDIFSDYALLLRVLMNLLTNALETSVADDEITCTIEKSEDDTIFTIHNPAYIPPEIQRRIFQLYFSTKSGRGFGTFGTKLICEKFLHGTIGFSSTESSRTQFHVRIPLQHSQKSFRSKVQGSKVIIS